MRSEREMLELIVKTAEDDDRIRAVIMNGSRANPNAPRDPFQDFDVVFLVTDVESFTRDHRWISCFGEMMILQMPDDMQDPPGSTDGRFAYLMQFSDGNRIDLTLFPVAKLNERQGDSLSVLLLDKDDIVEPFNPPSERDYLPKPPTAKAFADCCNEFWWVSPYVAKGLWRGELTYARFFLDQVVRDQLSKMIVWYAGMKSQFSRNMGSFGKYLESYLEPELWELLQRTYADADDDNAWEALLIAGDLFQTVALEVAAHFGFEYPHGDDARVSAHLRHVRTLPQDAKAIY